MPRADDPKVIAEGIEPECCHVVDVGCEAPAGWISGRLGGFEYIDPDEYKKAKARR